MHLYSKCCDIRIDKSKSNFFEASSDALVTKLNKYIGKIRYMKKKSDSLGSIEVGDIVCKSCNSLCNYLTRIDDISNRNSTNLQATHDPSSFNEENNSNAVQHLTTQPDMSSSIEENEFLSSNSDQLLTDNYFSITQSQSTDVIYERNIKLETNNTIKRDSISISIPRTISTHKYCVLCKSDKVKLKRVTIDVIVETFIITKILIPNDSRCCFKHFDENGFLNIESVENLRIASEISSIGANDLAKFFCNFRKTRLMNNSLFQKFNNLSLINPEQIIRMIGFTKEQVFYIVDSLKSLNDSPARSKYQAVVIYLFWLKSGLAQDCIAGIFDITQQDVSRYCSQVREAFLKCFVADNLGPNHKSREKWIEHNTIFVQEFFIDNQDQLALVADGTYCYCEKSSNNFFQKLSYSGQKKRHLLKPFVICTSDGYIVDIYGFYKATSNDAQILTDILKNDNDITSLIKPNDVFLLDRGFRDCVKYLRSNYGIQTQMPSIVPPNQKQLKTLEANQSRLVTKCRWVVEGVNGFLKNFKALSEAENSTLFHLIDDYKIAASLINVFYKRLISDELDDQVQLARDMKNKIKNRNSLEYFLTSGKLSQPNIFEKVESIDNFPRLSYADIKNKITYGSYQLKQSYGYLTEFVKKSKEIKFFVKSEKENLYIVKVKIPSRHINKKDYDVYIKYIPNIDSTDSIEDWVCTCKNGKRTVGCCSHVCSIILLLSNINDLSIFPKPAEKLSNIPLPIVYSDSEDDPEYTSDTERVDSETNNLKYETQEPDNSAISLSYSSKRPLSTYSESQAKSLSIFNYHDDNIKFLYDYLPKWGGRIDFDDEDIKFLGDISLVKGYKIMNTCTIDYFLFGVWLSLKLNQKILNLIDKNIDIPVYRYLSRIIITIEAKNWNKAKSIWINFILMNKMAIRRSYSCFGSENEFFISFMRGIQEISYVCVNVNCSRNNDVCRNKKEFQIIFTEKNKIYLTIFDQEICSLCYKSLKSEFKSIPCWIIFETLVRKGSTPIFIKDIPLDLKIDDLSYKLLFATYHINSNHFKSIFYIKNEFYSFDDLTESLEKDFPLEPISTVVFFLNSV